MLKTSLKKRERERERDKKQKAKHYSTNFQMHTYFIVSPYKWLPTQE